MSISDKTRKILWSKSGNCCAMCNQKLVVEIDGNNTVIGEECHIISSKQNGPRHKYLPNYDTYDNLILMCPTHHKIIDDNEMTYTEELLHMLKKNHENSVFIKSKNEEELNIILTKSTSVRDLVRAIYNAEQFATDYPVECKEDYELFQEFIDLVNNSDVLYDYDEFERMRIFNDCYEDLIKKNYCILLGRIEKFGPYKLDTVFVYIVTNKEYEDKKVCYEDLIKQK